VIGAWFSRARVFFSFWARVMATLHIFAVSGGVQGFAVAGVCPVTHAPSPVVFPPTTVPAWGVFLAFDRLYLTVCFELDLSWPLLLSTDHL